MAKVHVLRFFAFPHDGKATELGRGLHEVSPDVVESLRSSAVGSALLASGEVRIIAEAEATEPKPTTKRRRRRTGDAETPTDSSSEES